MRRKEESSKQGQTNNKAKQHSTPKAVTFPKKNEMPRVGLEPTTLYTYSIIACLSNARTCDVSSSGWNEIPESVSSPCRVVWNCDRSTFPSGSLGMTNTPSVTEGDGESLFSFSARMTLKRCVGTATLFLPIT